MHARAMPLLGGVAGFLMTFGMLRWAWLALFTSVGSMILAAVIAHAVGAAVAMILDLPSRTRNVRTVFWRVLVAIVCAPILLFIVVLLIQVAPRVFYLSGLGLIGAAVIACALC